MEGGPVPRPSAPPPTSPPPSHHPFRGVFDLGGFIFWSFCFSLFICLFRYIFSILLLLFFFPFFIYSALSTWVLFI